MNSEQEHLLERAVAEAARDPAFGRALQTAIGKALPKKQRRRQPPVLDVFAAYERGGEQQLRGALAPLTADELKDIVAQHRMDRAQLAMKWRTPARLIELIVASTRARAHKGEAFMGSAVSPPQPAFLLSVDEPVEIRLSLNTADASVKYEGIRTTPREATLRQGGDFIKPVYPAWKDALWAAGVTYQTLQSAASANRDAWRAWADGELPWRRALEALVERLNEMADTSFRLAD